MAASVGNQEGIQACGFDEVPQEITSKILRYLDGKNLFSAMQVNRQWKDVILQNEKSTNRENFTHIIDTLIKYLPDNYKPILLKVKENYEVEEPNSLVEPGRFTEAQKVYIKSQFPKDFVHIEYIKNQESIPDNKKIIMFNFLIDISDDDDDRVFFSFHCLMNIYINKKNYCSFNSSLNRLNKLEDKFSIKASLIENGVMVLFNKNRFEGALLLNSISDDSLFHQSFKFIFRHLCENNRLNELDFLLNNSEIMRIPFADRVLLVTPLIEKQWYSQIVILLYDSKK